MMSAQHLRIPLLSFLAGIVLVFLALQFPATRELISLVRLNGYPAAVLAGVLYSPSFTSPFATAMFFATPATLNPLLIALLGACGAVLYDITLFLLARNEIRPSFSDRIRAWWSNQRRLVPVFWLAGIIVLASPLPDEMASALLGMGAMPARVFLLLSFVLNALGIFTVVALGR